MAGLARSWFLLDRQCDVGTGRVLHRASHGTIIGRQAECERAPPPNHACDARQEIVRRACSACKEAITPGVRTGGCAICA